MEEDCVLVHRQKSKHPSEAEKGQQDNCHFQAASAHRTKAEYKSMLSEVRSSLKKIKTVSPLQSD